MKRKIFIILKLLIVLIVMLFILSACGKETSKKDKEKFSSHEDFAEKVIDSINNQDLEKFYNNYVDPDAMMAYNMYTELADDEVSFDELYEFTQKLDKGTADTKEYAELMEKLEMTEEDTKNFSKDLKNLKNVFLKLEENFESMKMSITSVSNEVKEFGDVYSCNVGYVIKIGANETIAKDREVTIYYFKSKKDYTLVYTTLLTGVSSNTILDKAQEASEETIIANINEELSIAFSFAQTKFNIENIGNVDSNFRNYCTLEKLEDNMQTYKFCTEKSAKKSPTNMNAPLNDNETVYVTDQYEEEIYEVKFSISSSNAPENIEIKKVN